VIYFKFAAVQEDAEIILFSQIALIESKPAYKINLMCLTVLATKS
jgi:hypothetical protein